VTKTKVFRKDYVSDGSLSCKAFLQLYLWAAETIFSLALLRLIQAVVSTLARKQFIMRTDFDESVRDPKLPAGLPDAV
jgi:hypothetical protein